MAQGDVTVFDQFLVDLCKGSDATVRHHFGTTPDTFKCAVVDSTAGLTSGDGTTAVPHWNGTGTTNLQAFEVTIAGDYVAGGNTLATPTVTLSGGLAEIDFGDPAAWTTGTDTDARWGVIYNDSNTNKTCVAFVDLGSSFDMSSGTLTITWGNPAITLNQA